MGVLKVRNEVKQLNCMQKSCLVPASWSAQHGWPALLPTALMSSNLYHS